MAQAILDTIKMFENANKKLSDNLLILKTQKTNIENDINSYSSKISNLEDDNITFSKIIQIYTQASTISRDNARQHFEKIVTDALQFVTQSKDYEFVIEELQGRTKASYEFYIRSTVNGISCLQKPQDANGGGFVDIISIALKYAYLELFNDPKIRCSTLIYDEPGKMISENMSIKFAEYIKFLGKNYGKQTIMVPHNDNIANVADKTFMVAKNRNGISTCNVITPDINIWELLNESGDGNNEADI